MNIDEFRDLRVTVSRKLVKFFKKNQIPAPLAVTILPYFIGTTAAGFGMTREELAGVIQTTVAYYDAARVKPEKSQVH